MSDYIEKEPICLKKFLSSLSYIAFQDGIKFIILRNYEGIPDKINSRDIDLLIRPCDVGLWRTNLNIVTRNLGLSMVEGPRFLHIYSYFIMGLEKYPKGLEIDLEPSFNWRGLEFLDVYNVYDLSSSYIDNYWIPHPAHECLITFCASYLYGGFVKDKYAEGISQQARKYTGMVSDGLITIFGHSYGKEILEALLDQNYKEIVRQSNKYRIFALLNGLQKQKLKLIKRFLISYYFDYRNKLLNKHALPPI